MKIIEKFGDALKRVVKVPSFQEKYEKMRKETLENPDIQRFFAENSTVVNTEMVERSMPKLYEFASQAKTCCGCGNTENCQNVLKGFVPRLHIVRNLIEVKYERCEQKVIEDERRSVANMISSMHMPKDVLQATLENLVTDEPSRREIFKKAVEFIDEYQSTGKLPAKGFYIYGPFGVGKSFILGALANELAALQIRSIVVFMPEFLRELKNSIQDQTLNEKIDFVKKAPVLMLDDIGAETMTAWTRDEILSTILHYRMSEQLPTFMTSNFNYDELEAHLAQSKSGDIDVVKAGRIIERIRALTEPIHMTGRNRRK